MEDPFESSISSSCSSRDEKVDEESVNDLLEECWFFENLFQRKTRMLRCYSDPCCPSSEVSQEISAKNSHDKNSAKNKIQGDDSVVQRNLIRAPSLPPCIGRKEEETQVIESSSRASNNLTRQSSRQHLLQALPKPVSVRKKEGSKEKESAARCKSNLQRAPSLPSYFEWEDISQDKERDTRMSKLIQEAFANSSDNILPQPHTSKGLRRSYSISRYRPPRISDAESNYNMNGIREMSWRYLNHSKSRKSPSDLESEEVQGFKDLGFTFEKQELSPSVVKILPGLQEKNDKEEMNQDNNMRRPYLSEAWLSQSSDPPPVPNWATKNSAEDMKAQIKFWARAVASNVHQEC